MSTPKPPVDHHYIPAFYLRKWIGADGKLERFWLLPDGRVHQRRVSPTAIGFEPNLYRKPGETADEWEAQALEVGFFSTLDNEAAHVLNRMLATDQPPQDIEARSMWAAFMLSLFHRTPRHLAAMQEAVAGHYRNALPKIEPRYQELRSLDDPPTFAEWEQKHDPLAIPQAVWRLLPKAILNENVGTFIINMSWALVDLSRATFSLLSSDNPIIFRPLKLNFGHIGIPIAPNRLFVATSDPRLFRHMERDNPSTLVRASNRLVVSNADRFVVGIGRGQRTFIERHIGTERLGSISTGYGTKPVA